MLFVAHYVLLLPAIITEQLKLYASYLRYSYDTAGIGYGNIYIYNSSSSDNMVYTRLITLGSKPITLLCL